MPIGGLLVGVGHPEQSTFVKWLARYLESDRQILAGKAAVYGQSRGVGHVERGGKAAAAGQSVQHLLFAADSSFSWYRRGWYGGCGHDQHVYFLQRVQNLLPQNLP